MCKDACEVLPAVQHILVHCHCVQVVCIFLGVGAAFVPLGYACLRASRSVSCHVQPFPKRFQSGLTPSGLWSFNNPQQVSHASSLGLLLQVVEASRRYDDICVPGETAQDRESFLYQVLSAWARMTRARLPSMLVVRSRFAVVAMAALSADI